MDLNVINVATILTVCYALVGAALVIISALGSVDPALQLTFEEYLTRMAAATAGLAIGRGISTRTNT